MDKNSNNNRPFGTFDWSNIPNENINKPKDITSDMWTPISAGKPSHSQTSRLNDREGSGQKSSGSPRSSRNAPGEKKRAQSKPRSAAPQKKSQPKKKRPAENAARNESAATRRPSQPQRKSPSGPQQRRPVNRHVTQREQRRLENDRKRYEKSSREYNKQRSAGKAGEEITKKRAKKKRRSKRFYALVVTGVTIIVATVAVLIFCFAVGSPISQITVEGKSDYSQQEIMNSCGVIIGDNIFTVSKKRVNDAVCAALPYIGSVEVKRTFPDKLSLTVTATKDKYLIKTKSGAYICLDENEKVLSVKKKKVKSGSYRLDGFEGQDVTTGEQYVPCEEDKQRFEIAKRIVAAIESNSFKKVNVIDLSDIGALRAVYDSHYNIFIGSTEDLENKIALAASTLKASAVKNGEGYVDVRFKGMAAFAEGSMQPQ